MWSAALLLSLLAPPVSVPRDEFGVPHVQAASWDEAFFQAGYAVAEDRLWQMEGSRRLARGKMAEVFGKAMAEGDKEVLQSGYTDEELAQQIAKLAPNLRAAYREYTRGVNAYIDFAKAENKLPKGYADAGFQPEPWTEVDSAAITVRLFQLFGRGGAGEVRNLALLMYLQNQPVKDKALDVVEDLAWFNDPASPTTVAPADDKLSAGKAFFNISTRAETSTHLAKLPKFGIFDLMSGLRLLMHENEGLLAQSIAAPFKAGSYAIVVGRARSATGRPLLLGAPQMGHTDPAIIHEMSIQCPGLAVVGMDVPGVPGIAIGHTSDIAWTLTSGVADTDDLYVFPTAGAQYKFGDQTLGFETIERAVKVKGDKDIPVLQRRTKWGPVILESTTAKAVVARRSSYRMREIESMSALMGLYRAKTAEEVEKAISPATMSFNFFYATNGGDIGYRYLGLVPLRPKGWDPRFPMIASPETDWAGMIPAEKMPQVRNPKSGLLTNWNNKPAAWWPNSDTPAWGSMFRVETLRASLPDRKLLPADLEMGAWSIARMEYTAPHFMPFVKNSLMVRSDMSAEAAASLPDLLAFDGRTVDGSVGATLYYRWFDALREELFLKPIGAGLPADTFRIAVQPSLMLKALQGKTNYDFLAGRRPTDVVMSAYRKAIERQTQREPDPNKWGYRPGSINYPGEPPIPYGDRGSYIQVVELTPTPRGRNVVPPGVAETGPHSRDQVPLARAWTYKPMRMK